MVVLASLALSPSAYAWGEYEPNDSLLQTAGPLSGSTDYVAGAETSNDVDWYRFYIREQVQLRIKGIVVEEPGDGCGFGDCECDVELNDRDGDRLQDTSIDAYGFDYLDRTLYDPGLYYIAVDCDPGVRYLFNLAPASAIVASDSCGEPLTNRTDVQTRFDKAKQRVGKLKGRKATSRGKRRKKIKQRLRGARSALKTARADLKTVESAIAANC